MENEFSQSSDVTIPEPTEVSAQISEPSPIPSDVKSAIVNNDLINIPIENENVALNVMVSFLNVAQKRGAFSFDESAKIWECIQKFIGATAPSA
jgi:hypothetical protein